MRVAIVHEWLVNFRGSERVLLELCRMFPKAVIYASVLDRSQLPEELANRDIRTTYIQRLPFSTKLYQKYLPLMPSAFENLDLSEYDLVISSSHACAKGVIPPPHAVHVCYCYTPMRYAWSGYHEYRKNLGTFGRLAMLGIMHRLREWDVASTARVDQFIACSSEVRTRIRRYYRRDAEVVFPPVYKASSGRRVPSSSPADKVLAKLNGRPFYLSLGRLVPYKRVDLALEACKHLGRNLVIAGDGPELKRLKTLSDENVHFIQDFSDVDAAKLYTACQAFLFPSLEDFGITVIEAQMHGKPVIAYGAGGALDTVVPEQTGVLFNEQNLQSIVSAMRNSEATQFVPELIHRHAQKFGPSQFRNRIMKIVDSAMEEERLQCQRRQS